MLKYFILLACVILQASAKPFIKNIEKLEEESIQRDEKVVRLINVADNSIPIDEKVSNLEDLELNIEKSDQLISRNLQSINETLPNIEENQQNKHQHQSKYLQTIRIFEKTPENLTRSKRHNGKKHERYRWPNATVPFAIDSTVIKPDHVVEIQKAMKAIENSTCVRFVNRTDQHDFVFITEGSRSCTSKVGRIGGEQKMKLIDPSGRGCFHEGRILHEMVHLLGFHHFHTSPLRDDHVKINWNNIDDEKIRKLQVKSTEDVTDFGTGYDYDSIVHANSVKYSKNNINITMETRDPNNMKRIGQRKKLSEGDVLRINRMYKCEELNYSNKTDKE